MDNTVKEVEILLVEDNPTDAELCIRALKKSNLANSLVWVKDGAEALDFLFATGAYSSVAKVANSPKVILLDLRLPKVDGMEVLRRVKAGRTYPDHSGGGADLFQGGSGCGGELPARVSTATSASRWSSMSLPRRCPNWDSTGCW